MNNRCPSISIRQYARTPRVGAMGEVSSAVMTRSRASKGREEKPRAAPSLALQPCHWPERKSSPRGISSARSTMRKMRRPNVPVNGTSPRTGCLVATTWSISRSCMAACHGSYPSSRQFLPIASSHVFPHIRSSPSLA